MILIDNDLQAFLAETYGFKPATELVKIDLEKINAETLSLTEVLDLINRRRYSEAEFLVILQEINLAIETFGLEKFKNNFLAVNSQVLSGKIEFKDLSPNLQNFMHSGYYCLQRLAEHLPEIWQPRKQEIDQDWDSQIVENHGSILISIYLEALAKLGDPPVTREVMLKVFQELIVSMKVAFAYKFVSTDTYQVIYNRKIGFFRDSLSSYIQSLIKNS
jgi:hypothetical protein